MKDDPLIHAAVLLCRMSPEEQGKKAAALLMEKMTPRAGEEEPVVVETEGGINLHQSRMFAENREGRKREDRSHCSLEERTGEVGRAHGIQMTSPESRCRRQNRVSSLEIVAAAKRHPLPGRRREKSPLPSSATAKNSGKYHHPKNTSNDADEESSKNQKNDKRKKSLAVEENQEDSDEEMCFMADEEEVTSQNHSSNYSSESTYHENPREAFEKMMKSFYGIEDSHLKLKEENAKLLAERQDLEDLKSKNAEMLESISQLEKQWKKWGVTIKAGMWSVTQSLLLLCSGGNRRPGVTAGVTAVSLAVIQASIFTLLLVYGLVWVNWMQEERSENVLFDCNIDYNEQEGDDIEFARSIDPTMEYDGILASEKGVGEEQDHG
nr:lisH domain-containing protein C1711.05-like [Ipomoea batatas]